MTACTPPLLLVQLDPHLGNFIVSSSVIRAIVAQMPDAPIALALRAGFVPLAQRMPGLPKPWLEHDPGPGSALANVKGFASLLREVRALRPGTVVDFGGSVTGRRITALSGARKRLNPRKIAGANGEDTPRHRQAIYHDLAVALGCCRPPAPPLIEPSEADFERCGQHLREAGLEDRRFVVLHVGAGRADKLWAEQRFAAVVDWLAERGLAAVLIGSGADQPQIDRVRELAHAQTVVMTDWLDVGEELALLHGCAAFVGNDSGPMHLAAAVGAPVVALFGPTDPARWRPLSPNARVLRGSEPLETGRRKEKFPDARFMTSLPVEAVTEALAEMLSGYNPGSE